MEYLGSILETIEQGGLIMYPIILLGFIVFTLIVERWIYIRRVITGSAYFRGTFFASWRSGDVERARRIAEGHDGPIARMMSQGLRSLDRSKEDIRERINEVAIEEMPRLERFLSTIAVIGTIMPILGLLGTVTGMISTFEVITIHGTGDPKMLAGGISEALITTQAGLIFALPILLVHNFLSSKVDNFISEMEHSTVSFLAEIESDTDNGGRNKAD